MSVTRKTIEENRSLYVKIVRMLCTAFDNIAQVRDYEAQRRTFVRYVLTILDFTADTEAKMIENEEKNKQRERCDES